MMVLSQCRMTVQVLVTQSAQLADTLRRWHWGRALKDEPGLAGSFPLCRHIRSHTLSYLSAQSFLSVSLSPLPWQLWPLTGPCTCRGQDLLGFAHQNPPGAWMTTSVEYVQEAPKVAVKSTELVTNQTSPSLHLRAAVYELCDGGQATDLWLLTFLILFLKAVVRGLCEVLRPMLGAY